LKTDGGADVEVLLSNNISVRRVAPGETNLHNAATIAPSAIQEGDRILARAPQADGVVATSIVVISKDDIAMKQAADRADWERRGVTGLVIRVSDNSIGIRCRTLAGSSEIAVTPAINVCVRRYEANSVSFSHAKPATFRHIRVGDQVRVRGTTSTDGTRFLAKKSWRALLKPSRV
jgi:hypothetical protein